MTLPPGARFGPYEILSPLGAGGMGEVYRARDTKLNRDVALKVLPEQFALEADRLTRFKREAQVLASLNHPNIAAIYGLEESDGTRALVLELVEGPTLAERLEAVGRTLLGPPHAAGPKRPGLQLAEALSIARQIAEALEAAHEKGIIHRDLKPANIKITADGIVKVLDFGLAKAWGGDSADLSQSPTVTATVEREGVIMGTAAYMSPEQARGQTVDKRADVWAFGCVLYEMLTGRRVFAGDTISDSIAAILERGPDWQILPNTTPASIRRLLQRCLEKDPKLRLHDIADARLELTDALREPEAAALAAPAAGRWRYRMPTLVAGFGITALVAAGTVWWMFRPESPPVRRFMAAIDPPIAFVNDPSLAVSPDGSRVVYVPQQQRAALRVRMFDRLETVTVAGTDTGHSPVFSPDGAWIAFFDDSDRMLKKVALAGGHPVTIAKAARIHLGATWGRDDMITFAGPGLSRVSAAGGTPAVLTTPDARRNETRHAFPDVLPNNRGVLFTSTVDNRSRIEVLRFDTGERRVLIESASVARYVPTGHVVYSEAGRLYAVPFDENDMQVTGPAVPVLEGVAVTADGPAQFSISREGSLVYLPGSPTGELERLLVWVELNGMEEAVAAKPRRYTWARVSPDGTRLAIEILDQGNNDIWVHDLTRNTQTRLTFDPGPDRYPLWTPDGRRIVFVSGADVVWKAADGTGDTEQLVGGLDAPVPQAWSRDGKTLLLEIGQPPRIHQLSMAGDGRPQPLLPLRFPGVRPSILPNGRWVAYQSNETGRPEVYVQPFPDVSGGRWQVSTEGGDSPVWSPDGRRLFYRRAGGIETSVYMAVPVEAGEAFKPGPPSVLFEGPYVAAGFTAGARVWDIAPDGRRFLMIKENRDESDAAGNLVVVQNWVEELKRLVPRN